MKRVLSFIIMLCTLLIYSVFDISHAESASGSIDKGRIPEDADLANVSLYNESAIAYDKDTQQLYVVRLSDGAVRTYPVWSDDGVDIWHEAILFSNGRDLLWAIEAEYESDDDYLTLTGAELCQWRIEGDAIVRSNRMDVDLSDIVEDGGFQEQLPQIGGTILGGDTCYMLLQRANGVQLLYCLSADGSLTSLPIEEVSVLLRADDEKIMYARRVEDSSTLEVYDMETEKSEVLFETQADLSRSYFSEDERVLYYIGDAVYKLEASRPDDVETLGACPLQPCGGLFRSGDHIVFFNQNQISIRDIHNMDPVQTLNVESRLSGYEITSNMLMRNSDVDIYFIDSKSYEALRDRGYCLPLTSPDVAALADGFYEEVRAEILDGEGNICALPCACSERIMMGVDTALWEELGFGDIPQTWDAFLDFLETDWLAYSRENADVRLLPYRSAEDTLERLFFILKADYENERMRNGAGEGYGSSVYQALLERLLSIDFESCQYDEEAMRCLLGDWSPRPSYITIDLQAEFMPLSIVEGVRPQIVLYPAMAFINPYSKYREEAQEYMAALAKRMDAETKIMLQANSDAPVRDEDYDETVDQYNTDIAQLKVLYETAEEVDKPQIRQDIDDCEAELQEYIREKGYSISPAAIAQYRKLISENGLLIQYNDDNDDTFDQVYELSKQLMRKQISVEQYTGELDRIIVQVERENQ